jgi:colanic acid biosynthesis glycosyl transferase WcaI
MPKALVLNHFHFPDDVAGAFQFTGLCEGLAARGWEVEVWPSNRACHHPGTSYPTAPEVLGGVRVHRVWRPPLDQHSFLGRLLNSAWMLGAWAWRSLWSPSPDAVITGSDPLFTVALTPWLKFRYPKARRVHWCFDVYPEYPIAEGMIGEKSLLVAVLRRVLRWAYGACDLVAGLGPRMVDLLAPYPGGKRRVLTPWAQEEPPAPLPFDPEERNLLFGGGGLGLLYSGNFGRPHAFELTLSLARKLGPRAVLAYSARGSRLEDLKAAVTAEDTNVRFVPFAGSGRLAARLSAPDVHVVSLIPHWTGIAVPSKFFGALAVGRPVLFEGDPASDIALWIKELGVGWVLTGDDLDGTAAELLEWAGDGEKKTALFRHCHEVYSAHFSRKAVLDAWDRELRALLPR